jgi:hypothetical protein
MRAQDIASAEVYYFGCWEQAGHYWRAPHYKSHFDIEDRVGSNIHPRIDSGFCPGSIPGKSQFDRSRPEVQGEACLHHVDGWTILSFWDRSVDRRGCSNSSFVVLGTWTMDDVLDVARTKFPSVLNRIQFKIVLVE